MKISRRRFIKASASTAALALVACKRLERGYPEKYSVDKPPVPGSKSWYEGEERHLRSVCLQCEGGCGIKVRVVEGRAVKIEPAPDYPTNKGGLCPKGLNGLQTLYDPDRIKGPLRRIGGRGQGKFEQISWDEAISVVAGRLATLRTTAEPHSLGFIGGRYRGHMRDLVRHFLSAYGTPNDIDNETLCSSVDKIAYSLTQGVRDRLAYDWEQTSYVVSFGAGLFESFRPTAMMLRIHGHLRQGTPGRRTKIVQIDPRYGVTSSLADEWVSIRPGTDGALALGLAHVLVRERLFDETFISDHTHGFEGFIDSTGQTHIGFTDILKNHSPRQVAEICDVPEATIERLAREMAANRPAIAVAGRGASAHTNGLYNVLAIHALNALLGSIDTPGGVMTQVKPPFSAWAEPEIDDVARQGLAHPRIDLDDSSAPLAGSGLAGIAERLEQGRPYSLKALLIYYTNPLFSSPEPDRLRAALMKVPFIVSFSPFLDETTLIADIVLPDHTYLERWQLDDVTPSIGYQAFGVRQPVVEPLHDTRSTGQVLIDIATAMGGSLRRTFAGKDELSMIKDRVRGVMESRTGSVMAEDGDDLDVFFKKILAAGGWWNPPYQFGEWQRVLATPTGKYEFFSSRLAEMFAGKAGINGRHIDPGRLGLVASGDEACLPHYEPIPKEATDAGFLLCSYKTMTHAEGRGANQPHLQELFGVQFDRCWEPWIEINPEDAKNLDLGDDDLVRLGSEDLRLILNPGVRRGILCVPFEYGHSAWGRWAKGRGVNVNELVADVPVEPFSGGVAWYQFRVTISKSKKKEEKGA